MNVKPLVSVQLSGGNNYAKWRQDVLAALYTQRGAIEKDEDEALSSVLPGCVILAVNKALETAGPRQSKAEPTALGKEEAEDASSPADNTRSKAPAKEDKGSGKKEATSSSGTFWHSSSSYSNANSSALARIPQLKECTDLNQYQFKNPDDHLELLQQLKEEVIMNCARWGLTDKDIDLMQKRERKIREKRGSAYQILYHSIDQGAIPDACSYRTAWTLWSAMEKRFLHQAPRHQTAAYKTLLNTTQRDMSFLEYISTVQSNVYKLQMTGYDTSTLDMKIILTNGLDTRRWGDFLMNLETSPDYPTLDYADLVARLHLVYEHTERGSKTQTHKANQAASNETPSKPKTGFGRRACEGCGHTSHPYEECKFKGKEEEYPRCGSCGKRGHNADACKSKKPSDSGPDKRKPSPQKGRDKPLPKAPVHVGKLATTAEAAFKATARDRAHPDHAADEGMGDDLLRLSTEQAKQLARRSTLTIDSGASTHLTGGCDILVNAHDQAISPGVATADGTVNKSTGTGDLVAGSSISILILKDVLAVPEFKDNTLISVKRLNKSGYKVTFETTGFAHVTKGNQLVAIGYCDLDDPGAVHKLLADTYTSKEAEDLASTTEAEHQACIADAKTPDTLDVWHRRLNHVHEKTIKKTLAASGVKLPPRRPPELLRYLRNHQARP